MKPTFLPALFFAILLSGCEQSDDALPSTDNSGVRFLIANLTGHTFPPNDDQCGDPVTVTFRLTSAKESKEIVVTGDDLGLLALDIEMGQMLHVSVHLEDGTITAEKSAVLRAPATTNQIQGHSIRLCPVDQIEFNF